MRTLISYSDFSHTASIHPTLEGKGKEVGGGRLLWGVAGSEEQPLSRFSPRKTTAQPVLAPPSTHCAPTEGGLDAGGPGPAP